MTGPTIDNSADEAARAWENEGGHVCFTPEHQERGIKRTLVEVFALGADRYSKLSDALAQPSPDRAAS